MINFAVTMSDEELIAVIRAWDVYSLPTDHRREGDDAAINDLMDRLKLRPDLVSKSIYVVFPFK